MIDTLLGFVLRVLFWPVEALVVAAVGVAVEPISGRFQRWVGSREAAEERFESGIRIVSGRQPGFTVGWREGVATLRRGVIDFEERVIAVVAVESAEPPEDERSAGHGGERAIAHPNGLGGARMGRGL